MFPQSVQIQSVLYHNEKDSLLKALDSLSNAVRVSRKGKTPIGEVTVCYGDASREPVFSPEEIEHIRETHAIAFTFRYRYFNENTGSAKGHNLLGETCESEYMVIMNPDVVVCPRFFEKLFAPFLNGDLNAGMTEAKQTPVEHPKEYDKTTFETGWATTACAAFPTSLFRELNGFDARSFFMYCDDLDFSWRIRLLGKKLYYCPDCVVYHAKNLSSSGKWIPSGAEVFYSAQAALIMAYKWSNPSRLKFLYKVYSESSDENLKRAAEHFDELKRTNALPKQLDAQHKVAEFVGDYYTKHRFVL